MFEAAQAAGASLGAHSTLLNAALQHAAIPAPLVLQKPKVTHRIVTSHASMLMMGCSLPPEWRLKHSSLDAKPMADQDSSISFAGWYATSEGKVPCECDARICPDGVWNCQECGHNGPSAGIIWLNQHGHISGQRTTSRDASMPCEIPGVTNIF